MTIEEMIQAIVNGVKRIDNTAWFNRKEYDVTCYSAGNVIRIDLKPTGKKAE